MKKRYILALFGLFLLAFILRIMFLGGGALSFAYDQARDAFVVKEILHGDLKILGPPVSGIPGLYHGVLYYYVLTLGYLVGNGDPISAAILMSILSSLTVFIIFLFTFYITGKKLPSFISALIFTISFEATQYSNFLVNASMGVWFVPLSYLGLYIWLNKKTKYGAALAGLGLGFAIQSEIALGYHLFVFLTWLYIYRKKILKKELVVFVATLILSLSPLIMSELRFHFRGLWGLVYLFSGKDAIAQEMQFGTYILNFFNITGRTFAYTLFPINLAMGGLMGFLLVFRYVRSGIRRTGNKFPWQLFLVSGIMAHLLALPFGGSNMNHLMVGVVGLLAVMTGIFIWELSKTSPLPAALITIIIVSTNLIKIYSVNPKGQLIFPYQKDLTIVNEKSLIDYTYREAKGEPFSINSLTSPLDVNTLWSYLYNYYGNEKYGYLPSWSGRDQIGQLGNNLNRPQTDSKLHFYIIEPTVGIPERFISYGLGEENSKSDLIREMNFGELKVQERRIK